MIEITLKILLFSQNLCEFELNLALGHQQATQQIVEEQAIQKKLRNDNLEIRAQLKKKKTQEKCQVIII